MFIVYSHRLVYSIGYKMLIFMYLFLQRNKETISLHRYIELCCIIISSMYFLLVTCIIEGTSLNVVISEQSGDFLYSWSRT